MSVEGCADITAKGISERNRSVSKVYTSKTLYIINESSFLDTNRNSNPAVWCSDVLAKDECLYDYV